MKDKDLQLAELVAAAHVSVPEAFFYIRGVFSCRTQGVETVFPNCVYVLILQQKQFEGGVRCKKKLYLDRFKEHYCLKLCLKRPSPLTSEPVNFSFVLFVLFELLMFSSHCGTRVQHLYVNA